MALSITTLCLVLGCVTLAIGSSGKGNGFCGTEKFYCLINKQCLNRELRCTASKVCVDVNGKEAKCFESSTPGLYYYYKKTSPLPSSGSSSKKKRSILEKVSHWFVEYRGFVYEFGATYGFHELDVNDPNYKYGPGGEKVLSEDQMGRSSCTRDQVLSFVDKWLQANPEYKFFTNNCQHFAKRLMEELSMNCPKRARRQDDNTKSLEAPSECFISEALRWRLHSLFVLLILFAILHNIN